MLGAGELVATLLGIGQSHVKCPLCTRRDVQGATLRRGWAAAELDSEPVQQQGWLEAVELLERGLDQAVGFAE